MMHLMAEGSGLAVHRVGDPGHLVDNERMRATTLKTKWGANQSAVGQLDTGHPRVFDPMPALPVFNLNSALGIGSMLQVCESPAGSVMYPAIGVWARPMS